MDELNNKKKLNLTITTPRGVKFEEEADMVIMRVLDGNIGVLPGHERISTVLGDGILRFINNDVERKLAVFSGIAEVNDDNINIFTTIAQPPEEIDLERAEQDRQKAEAALAEKPKEPYLQRAHLMIRRSSVRIEVSQEYSENISDD
ncbi:F0F1 ATP synthase subunit epsilon [Alkalibacterium sp. s-m-22]|uniref:ATP synthase epsilon chain n=1 Tax=Alkalibacterium indicireducens TaxID=398758 RepID=A0ABP3L145_9LACT